MNVTVHSVFLVVALTLSIMLLATFDVYGRRKGETLRRLSGGEPSRNNCIWVAWKKQLVCSDDTTNAAERSPRARPGQKIHSPLRSRDSLDDISSIKTNRPRKGKASSSLEGHHAKRIHGISMNDRNTADSIGDDGESDSHDMTIVRCTGLPGPSSVAALVPALADEFRWAQAGNPLRARAFTAKEVEKIELKYSQQLKAQRRTRGCVPLPAWVSSKSSGGSFGQSSLSEVFKRLPAMMHNRTVVFVGDSQSAALHLDLAWAVEVNTGLTPYRRTNPSGAACSIWPSTSFAVCSLRAGTSHGGGTLRLSTHSAGFPGGGAAAFPSSSSSSWRTTAFSEASPQAAVQRSNKRLYNRISSGTRSSSKGLITPPVCEALAKLPANRVAAHALRDVVMCLGAVLPEEVGGLSPRNIIVASSNSGGGRSGGSASNRFSGSVDHEDDVEELMEWYQNLELIVRPTLLWRESLPTHYAPSILFDSAPTSDASSAAERARHHAQIANSKSVPGEWSPILEGSCEAIRLAAIQDNMDRNNHNRSRSGNVNNTAASSSIGISTSVSGKGRKGSITTWNENHYIARSPPSAQTELSDTWRNGHRSNREGHHLQDETMLDNVSRAQPSPQLQSHTQPMYQSRFLSATTTTMNPYDHNPYAVFEDPLAAWRASKPQDETRVSAKKIASAAHATAILEPFRVTASPVSMPRPIQTSSGSRSTPHTNAVTHPLTSSISSKAAPAVAAVTAVTPPVVISVTPKDDAAKEATRQPIYQSGCAPLPTMNDFNSSGNSWSASSQSWYFIGVERGGDAGSGMQSANAKNLPAVRKAGVPVVSLWTATAPFWDLHGGCPLEDSSLPSSRSRSHQGSSSEASPDCTSWPYPSPVLRFANLQVIVAISRMVTLQPLEKKISAPTGHSSDSVGSVLRPESDSTTNSKSHSVEFRQNISQQKDSSVALPPIIRHPFGRKPGSSGAPLARAFAAPPLDGTVNEGKAGGITSTASSGMRPRTAFVERAVDASRLVASRAFTAAQNLLRGVGGFLQTS